MIQQAKQKWQGLPEWLRWALPIVLILLILWKVSGMFNGLLVNLGLKKTPGDTEYQKNVDTAQVEINKGAKVAVADQYAKQKSTKTDADWVLIARAIADDLHVKLQQNVEDAGYQLCRVQNDTDVYKLIDAFGEKSVYFYGIPYNTKNLAAFVTDELSADKVKKINANYQSKGIKFRW